MNDRRAEGQLNVEHHPSAYKFSWAPRRGKSVRIKSSPAPHPVPVDRLRLSGQESPGFLQIGEWVLHQVCAQLRSWIEAGHPGIVIAVNLSPRQFHQPDIVEMIARALSDYDLPPHLLELEITESSLMRNPEEAAILLGELSEMGFRLSVDDFGTGYSSLGYLKRFPLDALKIDRSFVADIESDHDSASIAAAVIALAHSLGLKVVAEGVELDSQMEYLRSLKCDLAQGYLLGRPMPADDLVAFMEKRPCQLHPTSLLTAP
jgi:EAL domain-containing protein (putative c-di-GMP-specific phosphodiesterase class I)